MAPPKYAHASMASGSSFVIRLSYYRLRSASSILEQKYFNFYFEHPLPPFPPSQNPGGAYVKKYTFNLIAKQFHFVHKTFNKMIVPELQVLVFHE